MPRKTSFLTIYGLRGGGQLDGGLWNHTTASFPGLPTGGHVKVGFAAAAERFNMLFDVLSEVVDKELGLNCSCSAAWLAGLYNHFRRTIARSNTTRN